MISGLGHIAIRAKDVEATVRFYTETLGLQEAFRLHTEDGALAIVYLYIAPSQFIEVFPHGKNAPERGEETIGMVHICLEVPDVEAAFAEAKKRGAPIDTEVIRGRAKCRQFWTHDPDGNPIELMELPPESLQAQATARFAAKENQ